MRRNCEHERWRKREAENRTKGSQIILSIGLREETAARTTKRVTKKKNVKNDQPKIHVGQLQWEKKTRSKYISATKKQSKRFLWKLFHRLSLRSISLIRPHAPFSLQSSSHAIGSHELIIGNCLDISRNSTKCFQWLLNSPVATITANMCIKCARRFCEYAWVVGGREKARSSPIPPPPTCRKLNDVRQAYFTLEQVAATGNYYLCDLGTIASEEKIEPRSRKRWNLREYGVLVASCRSSFFSSPSRSRLFCSWNLALGIFFKI